MLPGEQHSHKQNQILLHWAAGYNLSSGLWLLEAYEMTEAVSSFF